MLCGFYIMYKAYNIISNFVKIVNQNVFTIGFPQQILNTKALQFNLKLEQDTITYLCYQTNHSLNRQEYVNWCNTTLTTQTRQQSCATTQNRMQLLKHFDAAMQDQGRKNWYDADYFVNDSANHDVNGAEFKDWRFPTKREFSIVNHNYNNEGNGGLLDVGYYWLSTQYDSNSAWFLDFNNGNQAYNYKYYANYVRAVRSF